MTLWEGQVPRGLRICTHISPLSLHQVIDHCYNSKATKVDRLWQCVTKLKCQATDVGRSPNSRDSI